MRTGPNISSPAEVRGSWGRWLPALAVQPEGAVLTMRTCPKAETHPRFSSRSEATLNLDKAEALSASFLVARSSPGGQMV